MACTHCGDGVTCFEQECSCACHDVERARMKETLKSELLSLRGYKARVSATVDLTAQILEPTDGEPLYRAAQRVVGELSTSRTQWAILGNLLDHHWDLGPKPECLVEDVRQILNEGGGSLGSITRMRKALSECTEVLLGARSEKEKEAILEEAIACLREP